MGKREILLEIREVVPIFHKKNTMFHLVLSLWLILQLLILLIVILLEVLVSDNTVLFKIFRALYG